jgi:hypothetical protein
MQHLEGSGTPVLYIGRTVLKGERKLECVVKSSRKSEIWNLKVLPVEVTLIFTEGRTDGRTWRTWESVFAVVCKSSQWVRRKWWTGHLVITGRTRNATHTVLRRSKDGLVLEFMIILKWWERVDWIQLTQYRGYVRNEFWINNGDFLVHPCEG